MGTKQVHRAVCKVPGENTAADALGVHDQVDGEIFDIKGRIMFQGLLVQRMQNGMTGSVGGRRRALCNSFAKMRGHSAERPLINLAFLGPREGYAEMLEFDHRRHGLSAHVLDGVLITQPV